MGISYGCCEYPWEGIPGLRTSIDLSENNCLFHGRHLEKIARLPAGERKAILRLLMILSGLRDLEETVEQEAHKMPILSIENTVLGREFKRAWKKVNNKAWKRVNGRCSAA